MNDIEKHLIRKSGQYTPLDVLEETKKIIDKENVRNVVAIVQTDEGLVYRINTELSYPELFGMLEFAKLTELYED